MQRFLFRLQRVLELWEKQADVEEIRLQELHSRRSALELQQQKLEQDRRVAERELVESRTVTASDLMALESFRHFTVQQRRQLALRQAEFEVQIEKQRICLMEARRRTRLMEKLRETRQAEWKRDFDRELDELAAESYLSRLARQRPGSA